MDRLVMDDGSLDSEFIRSILQVSPRDASNLNELEIDGGRMG